MNLDMAKGAGIKKFGEVDVLKTLGVIMETNTEYYKSDFEQDIKILTDAARKGKTAALRERTFLWMSRPCGTWCLQERDVFLKASQGYNVWTFYGEQTHDNILAYIVEVSGIEDGKVMGSLYELDYRKHFQHVKDTALPAEQIKSIYEHGTRIQEAGKNISRRDESQLGKLIFWEHLPNNPDDKEALLCRERRSRERLRLGDIQEHIIQLQKRSVFIN